MERGINPFRDIIHEMNISFGKRIYFKGNIAWENLEDWHL
jgi:hypothetical protein